MTGMATSVELPPDSDPARCEGHGVDPARSDHLGGFATHDSGRLDADIIEEGGANLCDSCSGGEWALRG